MAFCGSRTSTGRALHPNRALSRRATRACSGPLSWLAGLAFLVVLAGCSLPPFSVGRPAPTQNLESLSPGVSSEADVRAALGEPRGYGATRHSPYFPKLDIWYYEYVQGKREQISLNILLVYFRGPTYQGHFWFAAKELVDLGA